LYLAWLMSILLLWASSIFLIGSYRNTLGKKFWIFIALPVTSIIYPLIYFLILQLYIIGIDLGILDSLPLTLSVSEYFMVGFIPAIVFGASLWTLRKIIVNAHDRNILILSGMGLFFYILSTNPSFDISAGHLPFMPSFKLPPYGIITLSLVGLFAYMINIFHVDDLPFNKKGGN